MPEGTKWSVLLTTSFYALFLTPNLYRERNVPVRPNHFLYIGSVLTLAFPLSLLLNPSLTTKPMVTIEYLCNSNQSLLFPLSFA